MLSMNPDHGSRYPRIARRGVAKNLTLEPDALVLLKALVPSSKGLGRMISELIRREYDQRAQRLGLLPAMTREGLGE